MVTVFTPTYNRGYIIERLYQSLKRQICKNFEWIVIDDGSDDNTEELFQKWVNEDNGFSIIYKRVKNGGKHRAVNIGVSMAKGEAFWIVDSDDYASDDAVEFIEEHFSEISDNENFAGISGLRQSYTDNRVIGGIPLFSGYIDASNHERRKYGLLDDKAEVYKTSVWKRFPFPEFEGENFYMEGGILSQIAYADLKIRWYNKVIYYCEYLPDGLVRNVTEKLKANPKGWADFILKEKKFANLPEKDLFKMQYKYFEMMCDEMPKELICELLEITEIEYRKLHDTYCVFMDNLRKIIQANEINTIALYGYGTNAARFMLYAHKLNLNIVFAIDRNFKMVNFKPAYSLEMDLPHTDAVFITLREVSDGLKEEIRQRCQGAYIESLINLDNKIW